MIFLIQMTFKMKKKRKKKRKRGKEKHKKKIFIIHFKITHIWY